MGQGRRYGEHEAASLPGCLTDTSQVKVSQPEPSDLLQAFLCSCSLAGWWHTHPSLSTLPETGKSPSHLPLPSFALPASSTVCQVYLSVFSNPALPIPAASFAFFLPACSNGLLPPSPSCSCPWRMAGGSSAYLNDSILHLLPA